MADKTDDTDDDFYDDPATMGDDIASRITEPDDTGEPGDAIRPQKYPLTPERDDYDLAHRGTLSEVEDGSREPGGEDHDTREDSYEPENDLEANIDTSDERDGSRG